MKANEFLHKKDVAYMNRLSTPLDFDRIVSLMEEYAALRIHDVVGRSEQFYCTCSRAKGLDYDEDGKAYCIDCGKYLEQTIP